MMKRRVLIYFCAFLFATVFYSCKNDGKIEELVKQELVKTHPNTPVGITVKDGVVTLTGSVTSEEEKEKIQSLIATVKDVKSVVNNIEVKEAHHEVEINSDETLHNLINTALTTAGFKGISVAIKDGEVTLTGDAKRKDLEKIMQIANEAKPKKVINELKLK